MRISREKPFFQHFGFGLQSINPLKEANGK